MSFCSTSRIHSIPVDFSSLLSFLPGRNAVLCGLIPAARPLVVAQPSRISVLPQLKTRDAKDLGGTTLVLLALCMKTSHVVGDPPSWRLHCLFAMQSGPADHREIPKWKVTKARANSRPREYRMMGVGIVYFWE